MDTNVIPFPCRVEAAPVPEPAPRLEEALARLQAALDEQRRALGTWRFAIAELTIGVAGLGFSLEAYRQRLASVGASAEALHGQSRLLEASAERAFEGGLSH